MPKLTQSEPLRKDTYMTPFEIVPYIKLAMAATFVVVCAYISINDAIACMRNLKESWRGIFITPVVALGFYSLYMLGFNLS